LLNGLKKEEIEQYRMLTEFQELVLKYNL